MPRATRTVLIAVAVVVALGVAAYFGTLHLCARQTGGQDDLTWLKREFRLSEAQMRHIRQLHEGYLPKCSEMCARIAAKEAEVDNTLAHGQVPETALIELATLRAQCQSQMLRHFQEVSKAMPPEQGKRYLAEMQRVTLGFHQEIERTMGGAQPGGHVHGKH